MDEAERQEQAKAGIRKCVRAVDAEWGMSDSQKADIVWFIEKFEHLRKERDEWKEKAEINTIYLVDGKNELSKERDEWKAKAERWARDFDEIKKVAEEERSLKLQAEQKAKRYRKALESIAHANLEGLPYDSESSRVAKKALGSDSE